MDFRDMPTQELIIRNGQPIWRVCALGLCVEDASGVRAMSAFKALCQSRGITLPETGASMPFRAPSDVDESGV